MDFHSFFKLVKYIIAFPLALMLSHLLSVAFVPDVCKNALITPVHKNGLIDLVANYRLTSITCVPCKLFGRIVFSKL